MINKGVLCMQNTNFLATIPKQEIDFLRDFETSEKISFGNQCYSLKWTKNGIARLAERASIKEHEASLKIQEALSKADLLLPNAVIESITNEHDGYFCLRSHEHGYMHAVLHVDNDEHRIRVVTYDESGNIYPHLHSLVVRINENKTVTYRIWQNAKPLKCSI